MKMTSFSVKAYPSVKGIYTALFLTFITASAFSQSNKWEFGIGLRPLTIKEEPYSFIFKRYLSNRMALRFGIGVAYNATTLDHTYANEPFDDSTHYHLSYDYMTIDRNFRANLFIGFQYGKRKNDILYYGAFDAFAGYDWNSSKLIEDGAGKGIAFKNNYIRKYDLFRVADFYDIKTLTLGLRPSFGVQYFINQQFSLSAEASISYALNKKLNDDVRIAYLFRDNNTIFPDAISYNVVPQPTLNNWNYAFKINPLALVSLNYNF